MRSRLRIVTLLGAVLILAGAAGFGAGSYLNATNDCGHPWLVVHPVEESATADLEGNATAFEDLSPDEQRIFLEAYTDGDEESGASGSYANWSASWFQDTEAFSSSPRYVRYRGGYYEVWRAHADCFGSPALHLRIAGLLAIALGWILLGVAGIWYLRASSD